LRGDNESLGIWEKKRERKSKEREAIVVVVQKETN